MSQTEKPTTTNLSRRGALAGLAGAAAVAGFVPAIAVSADDAELLALKAKFDPLFATWVKMKAEDQNEHNALIELYERTTGLRYPDRPAWDWNNPAFVAYRKAWDKCIDDFYDEKDDPDDPWDKLTDALNPLAAEILSYNASTFDGLRLQLRALISAYDETWDPAGYEPDEQPEHPCMRNFIESAAGVLAVPFPPF